MAATTMNISLTEDLKVFIDDQVAKGAYATANEYVQALVQRERQIAHVQALLDEAERSPLGPPVDEAYFERMRQHIRERARLRA